MSLDWLRLRWLFNRRTGITLLWAVVLLGMAVAANLVGIRMLGSIDAWQNWMTEHAGHFLAWRVLLYAGTACGWIWMRRRLRAREPGTATHHRLLRAEIAAVLAIVTLEGSLLLQAR